MPHPARPSLTLAIEIPDHRALAQRFNDYSIPPLTCEEAAALADLRVTVPADTAPSAVELAVKFTAATALRGRLILAKAITGSLGEVFVADLPNRRHVLVGMFAAVNTDERAVSAA